MHVFESPTARSYFSNLVVQNLIQLTRVTVNCIQPELFQYMNGTSLAKQSNMPSSAIVCCELSLITNMVDVAGPMAPIRANQFALRYRRKGSNKRRTSFELA